MTSLLYCVSVLFYLVIQVRSQKNIAPVFTNGWAWSMNENEPVGSIPRIAFTKDPVTLEATDPDSEHLTYRVKGAMSEKYFTVDETGVVKLRQPFNREVDNAYTLKFTVSDGENEEEQEAYLRILDVNDNPPAFNKVRYEFTAPENLPIGTDIDRVFASDPDEGAGGIVRYFLEESEDNNPFDINTENGILSLRESIDYETVSLYRLLVIARDKDQSNSLSSSVTVVIKVEDMQDTNPVFQNLPYDTYINENLPEGTDVLLIKAVDGDLEEPNYIGYSLRSGDEDGKFMLTGGRLRISNRIDRDEAGFNGVFRLTIRATEIPTRGSVGGAFTEITFRIFINDLNDELPQFEKSSYNLSQSEGTPVGTSLPLNIQVSDMDQGVNSDVTMSVEWKWKDLITVSPVTFRRKSEVAIVLRKPLDYESLKKLQFQIFANESNNPRVYSACTISIDVINENDNAPVFEQTDYQVNVTEGTAVGNIITQVLARDADLGKFKKVSYSMENNRGEIRIHRETGQITLLTKLDYEESRAKQYLITATDLGFLTARSLLTINVIDENDNPPIFQRNIPVISLSENTRVPKITTIQATDADSYPHNIIRYAVVPSTYSRHFSIDSETGVINVKKPFDYESIDGDSVELKISATDSGSLYSTATLVVNVKDENDHYPEFINFPNFTIAENRGGGILLGSIEAQDRDSDQNGEVRYYVTEGQEEFGNVFQLNERTGKITTKPGISPDYEKATYYDITVTCQDEGNPTRSTSQSLRIAITDVNDNVPTFTQPFYEATVEENSRLSRLQVRATDEDSEENADVRYRIIKGNVGGTFSINDVTGVISQRKPLDYEQLGGKVTLEIEAEDRGDIQLSSTVEVSLTIVDVNDNKPVFHRGTPKSLSVLENVISPTVGVFKADDRDSGSNARITYSIEGGNEKNRFSLSPLDGELRVMHGIELDREDQETYNLTIAATDSGSNPLSTHIYVLVQITDVNDNTPEFIDLPLSLNLSENKNYFDFYQLRALDVDSGRFGSIVYSVTGDDDIFVVNTKTGFIDLVRQLDREVTKKYILHVTARDNPRNPKNSRAITKSVTILVDDVNDETPRFVGLKPYQAAVVEESPSGTAVEFTSDPIMAVDGDEGENAVVTYSIHGGKSSHFSIDPDTGTLHTTTRLDRDAMKSDFIELTVRATDIGGRFSDAAVRITVLDINDSAPKFKIRRIEVAILESAQPGHVAAQMNATDRDQGLNGQIFYRIRSGAYDKFVINSETGVIYLALGQFLDREDTSQYNLKIVATDGSSTHPRSATARCIIRVDDVNDSRPRFHKTFDSTQVHENTAVGTRIAQLSAVDDDLEPRLVYYMRSVSMYDAQGRPMVIDAPVDDVRQSDNDEILAWFHLNPARGEITLKSLDLAAESTVDRERCSLVFINFIVRDEESSSEEKASSTQEMTLRIDIFDQNDNSPEFEILTNVYTDVGGVILVDMIEECTENTRLFLADARDRDQEANGQVTFELEDNGANVVQLQSDKSGIILSSSRIDRERLAPFGGNGWINVTLIASDSGSPSSRSTRLPVNLRVLDINDNSPIFSSSFYEATISENARIDSFVTTVSATDHDDGDFGEITYSLFGAMGVFDIHPQRGTIIVKAKLDRENSDRHIFTVIAKDNIRGAEEYRREASIQVTVLISDENDNVPVFNRPLLKTIPVFENTAPGTSIAMVKAFDPDDGENGLVTYSLNSFADFFDVDPFGGEVTISRRVVASRNAQLVGNITIFARDGGGLESNMTLQIEIIDINNHRPKIVFPNFNVIEVLEEQPGGLFVTQVNATDDDMGLNGVIRYKLHDPDLTNEKAFFIDDVSGKLVTSRKLDRELRDTYTLYIQAHDLGTPEFVSSKILTIHLKDVNDNRPVFAQNNRAGATLALSITEDAPIGTVVGEIMQAMDRDVGAVIFYHILFQDGDAKNENSFRIDHDRIIVNGKLDRETKNRYNLIVGATNNENFTLPSFTHGRWDTNVQQDSASLLPDFNDDILSSAWNPARDPTLLSLKIDVFDVIDEPPTFSRQQHVTAIEADAKSDTLLIKMNATDRDVDDILTYSMTQRFIKPDNISVKRTNVFIINPRNGVVSTRSRLTEKQGHYQLTIFARDLANFTASTLLTVYIRQTSQKLQFVIECPPDVINEHIDQFTEILRNITGSIVTVDTVKEHMNQKTNKKDATKTDVSVRIFDLVTTKENILQKLYDGTSDFEHLFKGYRFYEFSDADNRNDNAGILRIGMLILFVLFLLVIVVFIILFVHMRRKYKEEIEKLKGLSLDDNELDENVTWRPPIFREKPTNHQQMSKRDSGPERAGGLYLAEPRRSRQIMNRSSTADEPTLASALLWSPSATRREMRRPSETRDAFDGDITLHAPGCEKPRTHLHGSDSGSSF